LQVIDRSLNSVYERTREFLLPAIQEGVYEREGIDKSISATQYTPKSKRYLPKKNGRTTITPKEVSNVAKFLINANDKIAPTSQCFWERHLQVKQYKEKG